MVYYWVCWLPIAFHCAVRYLFWIGSPEANIALIGTPLGGLYWLPMICVVLFSSVVAIAGHFELARSKRWDTPSGGLRLAVVVAWAPLLDHLFRFAYAFHLLRDASAS